MKRIVVRALARTDEVVDELLYRPAVVTMPDPLGAGSRNCGPPPVLEPHHR
jgi:hypothetical protein